MEPLRGSARQTRVSLRLDGNRNVATFFAYLADWMRKRNSVLRHIFAESGRADQEGWGGNRGEDRFADDDNDAEVSFAKSCSGIRPLTSFCAFPACETSLASPALDNVRFLRFDFVRFCPDSSLSRLVFIFRAIQKENPIFIEISVIKKICNKKN